MLTTAQLQTLKTAIAADPAMSSQPMTSGGAFAITAMLNAQASPAFKVWRSDAPVDAIIDSVTWASYTPNDKVSAADTDPALSRKIGWLLEIQTKQMNLQLMLQGRSTLDCSHATLRAGLRDAVIQVPSGAGGAATSPGGASGATVMGVCVRDATLGEKILAGNQETTGGVSAAVLGYEGSISSDDVQQARELP